jgi:hypothetical protein
VKRSATELCVKGSIRALCKINKRKKRVSMAEIVTCVRCGQWVHDPENGRVCAECKAADIEDENRQEIEFALAISMRSTRSRCRPTPTRAVATPQSCSIAGTQWVMATTGNGC